MTDDGDDPTYYLAFSITDKLSLMVFDDESDEQPVDECSVGRDLDIEELEEAAARITDERTPDDLAEARERVRKLINPLRDKDDHSPYEKGRLDAYHSALTVIGGEDRGETDDEPDEID